MVILAPRVEWKLITCTYGEIRWGLFDLKVSAGSGLAARCDRLVLVWCGLVGGVVVGSRLRMDGACRASEREWEIRVEGRRLSIKNMVFYRQRPGGDSPNAPPGTLRILAPF